MKCYRCDGTDPYRNAAVEFILFSRREEALYLWKNEPCVFIGSNQNPYAEIDLDYAKEKHIQIVRRISGGGAVFQDLGNLNYSLIAKEENFGEKQELICRVLRHMGFPVVNSGRNDIMIAGKKLGGTAWFMEDGWVLLHGTLLIDTDLSQMQRILTPSKLKLRSHGIESVRSRVMNLSEIAHGLTAEAMMVSFERYFGQEFQNTKDLPEVLPREMFFRDEKRTLGDSPQYDVTHEVKTSDGIFQFQIYVENGRIQDVLFFSDAMVPGKTVDTGSLIGQYYDPVQVEIQIRGLL